MARRIVGNPYFDLGVLIMILVSIVLLVIEIALPNSSPYFDFVVYSGDIITCLFVVELLIRLAASRKKRRFFSEYFIDILAVLPLFRAFRFLRFLRLLRMLRIFRAVSVVARNTRVLQWLFKQRMTEYLMTVVLLLFATLFGTLGLSHFRRPVGGVGKGQGVDSPPAHARSVGENQDTCCHGRQSLSRKPMGGLKVEAP